jgi:hypothetical protein
MRRIGLGVLMLALAGMGCVTLPTLGPEKKDPEMEPIKLAVPRPVPPPPVVPDQVNEGNAAQKARDLRVELEYATAQEQAAPAPIPEKAKK